MNDDDVLDGIDDLVSEIAGKNIDARATGKKVPSNILDCCSINHDKETGTITAIISRRIVYVLDIIPVESSRHASDFFLDDYRKEQLERIIDATGCNRADYITRSGDDWKIRITRKKDITREVIDRYFEIKIAEFMEKKIMSSSN